MDPNEVVGTPTERQIWLAPDWSKRGSTAAVAGPGSTQVWTRTVTYRNGRVVTYVLDEKHTPITSQLLSEDTDPDVKKTWDSQQSTTKAPNGQQFSRGPDGTINEWNPNSNPPGYTIPRPDMSPAGTVQTPEAKATAQEELRQKQDNQAAGKGYLTNEQIRANDRQAALDAQNAANTTADNQRADAAAAQARAIQNRPTVTIKEDGSGGLVSISTDPTTGLSTPHPIPGVRGTPDKVTVNGTVYERGPDGAYAPAAGLPRESKPGQVVTLNGESYWATPNADPSQPPQLSHMDPGTRPTDSGPQLAPGMSSSEYLNQRRAWLMDQRKAGVSQKEINDLWDRDVQTATSRQNEANTQATQQNQRLSTSMSGFGQALNSVQEINKYLPVGSDLGGQALDAFLTLQRGQAQRMGGYGPLSVPSAPTAPDPSSQVAAIPQPPSAVGPVAAGVTATNAAAINPTGQNVQAANGATMRGSQAAFGALGVPPAPAAAEGAPVSAIPESPYEFQTRIASTPPWKLDEDTWQQAQALGLGDHFWNVPSGGAVSV